MKLDLEINNLTKSPIKYDFFVVVVKRTFKEVRRKFLEDRKVSLSIALVNSKKIRELNRIYRKKDEVTDVLSFCEYKNWEEIKRSKGKNLFLGELIICYDDIKKYAKRQGTDTEEELANVISHGILHLLGFKHGEKMFTIQKRIKGEIASYNKNK